MGVLSTREGPSSMKWNKGSALPRRCAELAVTLTCLSVERAFEPRHAWPSCIHSANSARLAQAAAAATSPIAAAADAASVTVLRAAAAAVASHFPFLLGPDDGCEWPRLEWSDLSLLHSARAGHQRCVVRVSAGCLVCRSSCQDSSVLVAKPLQAAPSAAVRADGIGRVVVSALPSSSAQPVCAIPSEAERVHPE